MAVEYTWFTGPDQWSEMEHRHGSRRDVGKDNGQDMQVSANNPHNTYRVAQISSVARRRGKGD